MKLILTLGYRNIITHKRRSLVVIFSIAIGIFAVIVTMAFINGINGQMVDNTLSTSLGHIAIHRKGFQENMNIKKSFTADQRIFGILKRNREILSFAAKVKVQGMLQTSEGSRGMMIMGIDPRAEIGVSRIASYTSTEEGSGFLTGTSDDTVLISRAISKKLDVGVGDKLILLIQNRENDIESVGMKVAGIFQTPVDALDKNVAYAGIRKIQSLTGMGECVSELTIILHDRNRVDEVKAALIKELDDPTLEVLSWKDMAPNIVGVVKLIDSVTYIVFTVIFLTIIFSIANTLIMAIMERFHEIGVMKSIGTRPRIIFLMFMAEAIQLGIAGLCLGVACGLLVTSILSTTGIDLAIFKDSLRSWGAGSVIFLRIRGVDIALSIAIVLFTTIVAALYPCAKAARIKPLDALNYI